ncbi:MAG: hypothetical protein SangKO_099060 [Sandaracinaceae bacterium]
MPYYTREFFLGPDRQGWPDGSAEQRRALRTLDGLTRLRTQLDAEIPPRTQEETLLLATWNIREFDSRAYGASSLEPLHYIAEIIARFDLVAVQEVRRDLNALKRLMEILGRHWSYLVTDVTEGKAGNQERMAYVFDTRKVSFGGLASELVLPPFKIKGDDGKTTLSPAQQLARTPFVCGFQAGWTKFLLATVHILYGDSKPNDPRRVQEIRQLAQFLRGRTLNRTAWSQNLIVLGDFNIFRREDATMGALEEAGFVIPEELHEVPGTNVPQNKHYDQIAFRVREDRLETTGRAGVFDPFESTYRVDDESAYAEEIGEAYEVSSKGKRRDARSKARYFKTYWRTHQLSDHLPMWVELRINYTDPYLARLKEKVETSPGGASAL